VIRDVTLCKRQQRVIKPTRKNWASDRKLMMLEERQRRQIAQALHDSGGAIAGFLEARANLLRQRGPEEVRAGFRRSASSLTMRSTYADLTFELSPSTCIRWVSKRHSRS